MLLEALVAPTFTYQPEDAAEHLGPMTASPILPWALKGAPNYPADQQDREEHCPLTPINDIPPCKQKWETRLFPYGPYSDAMVKIYTSITPGNDHIQVLMYFEFQKDNWVQN